MKHTHETGGEFLDVEAMASLLPGVTPAALYTQRHRGQEPGSLAVLVGRRLLWKRTDVDEWFASQRVGSTSV